MTIGEQNAIVILGVMCLVLIEAVSLRHLIIPRLADWFYGKANTD